jgi:hypothetical protein
VSARAGLRERSVVVLRDQKMTPKRQPAFCARFAVTPHARNSNTGIAGA